MVQYADQSRYEYKYRITDDLIPRIREYSKVYTTTDPALMINKTISNALNFNIPEDYLKKAVVVY